MKQRPLRSSVGVALLAVGFGTTVAQGVLDHDPTGSAVGLVSMVVGAVLIWSGQRRQENRGDAD